MKTADQLREEAARIREFAPWVHDEEVVAEILALAEELERRAHEVNSSPRGRRLIDLDAVAKAGGTSCTRSSSVPRS